MQVLNTNDIAHQHLNVLVYGRAGAGKTFLSSTTPGKCLILSVEAGLLSLFDKSMDFWTPDGKRGIKSIGDLQQAYSQIVNDEHDYEWIYLDSISEIAEVCLAEEKKKTKDGRQAYGELGDIMLKMLRAFRDLPFNVVMTAQLERREVDGRLLNSAAMPGNKLRNALPHIFDEMFALRVERTDDGVKRYLQTQPDIVWDAKDRSGKLDVFEPADLAHIHNKIFGKQG